MTPSLLKCMYVEKIKFKFKSKADDCKPIQHQGTGKVDLLIWHFNDSELRRVNHSWMGQPAYVEKLLDKQKMSDEKPVEHT